MSFLEIRFPDDIAYGSTGGPGFRTEIVQTDSGAEYRNIRWGQARAEYNVAYGVRDADQLTSLIAMFRVVHGRAHGFRYKDWDDYQADGDLIGTGDNSEKNFQLIKSYTYGSYTVYRTVKKPVAGTTRIYLDGVEQLSGWSIVTTTGIVTFVSAPGVGVLITADFEFDVPVRFDIDRLSVNLDDYGLRSAMNVPLIEVPI